MHEIEAVNDSNVKLFECARQKMGIYEVNHSIAYGNETLFLIA